MYLFLVFTIFYTVAITLVLLNVIFGIIIDAFGQLRDEQDETARLLLNTCFICGKDRNDFDDPKVAGNFEHHINHEHNVWHYICFLVLIYNKKSTELTGAEHFVKEELKRSKLDWFPMNRALVCEPADASEDFRFQAMQKDIALAKNAQSESLHEQSNALASMEQSLAQIRETLEGLAPQKQQRRLSSLVSIPGPDQELDEFDLEDAEAPNQF